MGKIVEETVAYLAGSGRHLAPRLIRRNRLPRDLADDVVQETLIAMHRAELTGRTIDNVEAYASRVMHNIVVDLVRGKVRRREVHPAAPPWVDDGEWADPLDERPAPDHPELEVLAAASLVDVRAAVARQLGPRPHPAAGALAVLALLDPDGPADAAEDCPVPKGGASNHEAAGWVGLFYAGRRDCWDGDGEPTVVRQRRSRYARAQAAVLTEAAADAGLRPGGSHA